MNQKHINKIVITGGPCAGKTTAMEYMQQYFSAKGYTVIFVPETATELILGGIAPWTCKTNLEYQICQVKLQLAKEEIFMKGIESLKADKIIMVCDRGLMDNKAYMTQEEFEAALDYVGMTEEDWLNSYEAVFHLETVAKDNVHAYTLDNNGARTETAEEAVALDSRLVDAWSKHPNLFVVSSHEKVEHKLDYLVKHIEEFLD